MRRPMKKGTQAWNCYGNRNNRFLLVNYGFCFADNLYDSFECHATLDIKPENFAKPMPKDLLVELRTKSPYYEVAPENLQRLRFKAN